MLDRVCLCTQQDRMLPLSPGRAKSHGFEYKRNDIVSLFAALNTQADPHTSCLKRKVNFNVVYVSEMDMRQKGSEIVQDLDVMVSMRDGVRLAVDVFRPAKEGKYPVLYACSLHNKDMQRPDMADVLPPQPAHSALWFGPIEAGDTRRFVNNGYVHIVAQARGSGKSEGEFMQKKWDHFDLTEWITQQPWCDGNVGMVGISAFAGEQWRTAAQQHPALKAIFPYDACSAYREIFWIS
jgi:predicted acyl esterase